MLLLALVTLSTFGWALSAWLRRERAVAVASASMGLVTGAAWLAASVELSAWREGGYGMHLVALIGGYAIGTAAGALVSGRARARTAALVGVVLLALSSGALFRQAMSGLEDAVHGAAPDVANAIVSAGQEEAMRLVQYASLLGVIAAVLLILPRRRRALEVFSPSPSRATA